MYHRITIFSIYANLPNGNLVVHIKIVNIHLFPKLTKLPFGWLHSNSNANGIWGILGGLTSRCDLHLNALLVIMSVFGQKWCPASVLSLQTFAHICDMWKFFNIMSQSEDIVMFKWRTSVFRIIENKTESSGGSRIRQRGNANSRVEGGANLLFGIIFAQNCMKKKKMDWEEVPRTP